jgi:hypothetical protein
MYNWLDYVTLEQYKESIGPGSQPKPDATLITMPSNLLMGITDMAISIHMRNLFTTYGEDVVKQSLEQQFGLKVSNG